MVVRAYDAGVGSAQLLASITQTHSLSIAFQGTPAGAKRYVRRLGYPPPHCHAQGNVCLPPNTGYSCGWLVIILTV